MDDDLVCEYDSTWDTESDGDELHDTGRIKKTRPTFWSNSSSRNLRAAKDMQNYRHGYPNINEEECPEGRMTNLKFYLNELKSSPDDVSIETFHMEWKTDYKRLERVHSYIQWLFPLREPGVNYMAAELTKKEILAFRESDEAKSRLVDSYDLMLGFYGIQLLNRDTGEVKRADNWRERFANLERNMHNNLRITRILKSLGELGFEHFQAPLVHFFIEETLVRKTLTSMKRSVLDYFLFSVHDKHERRNLVHFAFQHFEPKDKFVWCPRKIQKSFKKKSEKWQNSLVGNGESSANDEGHVRHKNKDGETTSEQKHGNREDDIKVDSEKQSESSEDLEPNLEGSSLDLPFNNGTVVDNEEMNNCTNEPSGVEGQQAIDDKISVCGLTKVTIVAKQILELETDQEVSKMKCACVASPSTVSAKCNDARDDIESLNCPVEIHGATSRTSIGRTMPERSAHNSPTQSSQKLSRSDFENTSGVMAHKDTSEDILNIRLVENDEKNEINCNQSNGPEKKEPMDINDSLNTVKQEQLNAL